MTGLKCHLLRALVFIASFCGGAAQAAPSMVASDLPRRIQALMEADIQARKLPGAVVLVGHRGRIVYREAFGLRALEPSPQRMTLDTVFDVASVSKVVATATSVMVLIERGELRLADAIGRFFPELQDDAAKRITVQQLLTHVAGYAPDFDLKQPWMGREGMLAALAAERLRHTPGTRFVYSDIGFIVLGELVERVSGRSLDRFFAEEIAEKIGMRETGFRRMDAQTGPVPERIAPTQGLRGQVHDPTARRMKGVAGHAGLFSTADDLALYCQMILSGGSLNGRTLMSASTLARMTAPVVVSEEGSTRGLGWDIHTAFSANRGDLFPIGSFGHTGFTGTSIWIDPASQTYAVFLSNRVHPDGKGDVVALRSKVMTAIAAAYGDPDTGAFRALEAQHAAQVAAQVPRFREQAEAARRAGGGAATAADARVLNGVDVLERDGFKPLQGLRIGLVTNHTGRNLEGRSTIDVLQDARNVKLVALFSPEHGIRGELDQATIADSVDEKTGLPIHSLYGQTRHPKPEQLQPLDALVFDIQDIGTRFYTYISTLQHVLEAAAKAGKPVFVLDRPNPINGVELEGPIAEADKLSFVATHTLPVRHGMTLGELALMFNQEKGIGADLRVVKMAHWSRAHSFDQLNQTWVNPSPNMRSLTQALLYPGVGLLEFTNLSVGRGTDTPFEWVGAPYIDGRALALHLNARGITGARFIPVRFRPNASVFKGEWCGGVQIVITDRSKLRPVQLGMELAVALRKLYPTQWKPDRIITLAVHTASFEAILRGEDPRVIAAGWEPGHEAFRRRRAPFLLY